MYSRKCPKCDKDLFYSLKGNRNAHEKLGNVCKSCAFKKDITYEDLHRLCPKCDKEIEYSNKGNKKRAEIKGSLCKKCVDHKNKFTEDGLKRISESHIDENNFWYGKYGLNHPTYGRKHTEESKRKMRLSKIERIKKTHGQISPAYNSTACRIIEQFALYEGINDIKHAENGGEFYIKGLGYWVDGYSPKKNIVIEYCEKRHKYQKDKDVNRKREIINCLGCKFIEIWESGDNVVT